MKRKGLIFIQAILIYTITNGQDITDEEKLFGLSLYWSEARYNFAYFDKVPNLDWDSLYLAYIPRIINTKTNFDYVKQMQAFAAHLKDGHSLVLLMEHITEQIDKPGILIKEFDNKYYIVNTDKKYFDDIPLGSEVVKVNGFLIDKYISDSIQPYISASTPQQLKNKISENLLTGQKNSFMTLTIRNTEGNESTIELVRNSDEAGWKTPLANLKNSEFDILENNVAYLQLNSFFNPEIVNEFKNALPEIRECKGVIFDVRNNEGGDAGLGLEILEYFTDSNFSRLPYKTRKHIAAYKAWGTYQLYKTGSTKYMDYATDNAWMEQDAEVLPNLNKEVLDIPVVILTGNKTYSAGEDFVVFAKQLGEKVKIIGEPTSGSSGQALMFLLPGGTLGSICAKRDYFLDNTKFVGYGLQPDIYIRPTIDDILNNNDVVLEKALELFN